MTAPTLFDVPLDPLPARSSDPATAKASARMLPIKERKREVLAAMERLSGTVTAGQIQADLARNGIFRERGTIASRLSQLERDGLVRKVGVADGDQGRQVITWERVP